MSQSAWQRFNQYLVREPKTGVWLDVSRVHFDEDLFVSMSERIARAFRLMRVAEEGGIANPDENRMVGHYWLRAPHLAPLPEIREAVIRCKNRVKSFAADVHSGAVRSPGGKPFKHVILIGIGGSALGPQFAADALADPAAPPMTMDFLDNTDPDGFDRVFARCAGRLDETLALVISKSGGTKETRNGMLDAAARFARAGLPFPGHAVAVTGEGSELDRLAASQGWLARFPMWDWVGGRTSVMSAVGLLPMALLGIDTEAFLAGAAAMDEATRVEHPKTNPAMLLALMWFRIGHGHGQKDMVILPYKDRLALFSRYLQQLVMESLGKEKDLDGRTVHQGLAVYGNKGSTDQHAYVQQLRDGVNNFFATFIEVRRAAAGPETEVEPGVTSGDYLQGFLRGTREALSQNDRETITLSLPDAGPREIGALIALYERAVGLYAGLVNINAYHQPGVEAGKKAASELLKLQGRLLGFAAALPPGEKRPAAEFAAAAGADTEAVFHLLVHLAANGRLSAEWGGRPDDDRFGPPAA